MIIQHNISALNAHRQLATNNSTVGKNLEKLSSGFRINRAGDDAAGLAISEKMRSQIKGLETAQKNAQDGISLVQTAEGALTEVHSMLNRMVELSTQASNGTYTNGDRQKIQDEVNALTEEIDRISEGTNFNGINLLDGSIGAGTYKPAALEVGTVVGTTAAEKFTVTEISGMNLGKGKYTISTGTVTAGVFTEVGDGAAATHVQVAFKDANTGDIKNTVVDIKDAIKQTSGASSTITTSKETNLKAGTYELDLSAAGLGKISLANVGDQTTDTLQILLTAVGTAVGTTVEGTAPGGSLKLQVGDSNEAFQRVEVAIGNMSSKSLGVGKGDIKVTSEADANVAIDAINAAIEKVSSQRGQLGAVQNRLEHTINNLGVTTENMTAAESRIRDVDMAKEMMAFTKNNVLTQAAQAMLAQANQQPQGVLQLLR